MSSLSLIDHLVFILFSLFADWLCCGSIPSFDLFSDWMGPMWSQAPMLPKGWSTLPKETFQRPPSFSSFKEESTDSRYSKGHVGALKASIAPIRVAKLRTALLPASATWYKSRIKIRQQFLQQRGFYSERQGSTIVFHDVSVWYICIGSRVFAIHLSCTQICQNMRDWSFFIGSPLHRYIYSHGLYSRASNNPTHVRLNQKESFHLHVEFSNWY